MSAFSFDKTNKKEGEQVEQSISVGFGGRINEISKPIASILVPCNKIRGEEIDNQF